MNRIKEVMRTGQVDVENDNYRYIIYELCQEITKLREEVNNLIEFREEEILKSLEG